MKVSFISKERQLKSIIEQIKKQQITVGSHLQNVILAEKQEEGTKVKTIREYMESQRGYVWEIWRASNLIQSLLLGIPIPEIIDYRADDKSQFRRVLDGQQRLTSIYLYLTDGFKLDLSKSIYPSFTIEGEHYTYNDIQDKLFSELPELFRDAILDSDLRLTTINNCDEEMAEKFFVSMNAGVKVLKPAEIRSAAMGITTRRFFAEVLKSDWMLHCLTPKAVTTNTGNEIVAQVITLMHNTSPIELSKENIDNVIYSYRDGGVPENMKEDIANIGNFLNDVTSIWIEDKKKQDELKVKGKKVSNYATYRFSFFNKTNTVMLMIAADQAIKNNVSVEEFAKWSYRFFENPNEDYKKGMTGKVNELQNVDYRMLAIQDEVSKLKKGEVKETVKKATAEEVFATLAELKNETPKTDDSTNIQENPENDTPQTLINTTLTEAEIATKEEFGNELNSEVVLGEDDAETLLDTSDTSKDEIAGDNTSITEELKSYEIEIGELTEDDIPVVGELEEQAS